ncbi:unnamed protein product [Onchocerca ochengi]|uniref:GYF domain-containing protein n=1 Tax=Onchocerca ochengi TaxID=42157 RepID=A0A182EAX5_ONCOC|nr:unnamed protein product [Onchocerca ochengi]
MSTTVVAADSNQLNFNPSWMRPVSMPISTGGGNNSCNRTEPPFAAENPTVDYPIADPIFVKNRYGREDLLALLSKDVHPPDGLDKCQFYVSAAQKPIVLTPLSDTETRLQHNINSSKAMSLLSHADRATIASGGMIGGPNIPLQLRVGQENRSFSPSWISASGGGNSGFGRGSLQFGRATYGGSYRGRGMTQTSSINPSEPALIGRTSANRNNRTGGSGFGRGNSTVQPFNARAQGLYDPRDPRDRPRQRLRSTSDDTSNPSFGGTIDDLPAPLNSGWTQVGRAAAPWNKRLHVSMNSATQQSAANAEFTSQSQLPEWMSDDQERGDSSNLEETGSFDDSGQFQTSAIAQRMATSLGLIRNPASNIPVDIPERQKLHQEEEKSALASSVPVTVPNTWSTISNNLNDEQPQSNRIAKHFVEKSDTNIILTSEQSAPIAATTVTAVNSPFQQNYTDDVTLLGHTASTGLNARNDYVDEWYYVDPKNAVQGPFPTIHMQAWYKLGYFTSELRVRHGQNPDNSFMTLGELITMNSEETPFKFKPFTSPVMQLPLQQTQEVRNIWSRDYNVSLMEAAKVKKERQKLEEEQRRMAEQERQLKEMREALLKEEEERLARERRIMEKELQLQRAQEELAQLAAEEKERAAAREREIEIEKKRLAEEMERTKKEEVERALAETRRKEQEREQQRLKDEAERRIKTNELSRIQEEAEEEARRTAAEQKRLRQQVSASTAAITREKENLHHKPPVELRKGNASKGFIVTEEFAPSLKQKGSENTSVNWPHAWQATYQSSEEKVITPKTAPWIAVTNKGMADRSEPSLLDIQQEEERQMVAEMKHRQEQQINGATIWKDSGEAARVGVWSSVAHKLKWKQDSQPVPDTMVAPLRQVAWGGAKGMNDITAAKAIWYDPSLPDNSKIKTNRNVQNANKSESGNTEHEAVKKIFKQSVTSSGNALTNWMINRVKQLNPQVDADVFAAFIEGVDNPNEVEDYIIGYLGENRLVRELIREFLERRSQARQKKEPVDKDDLTHPAQAADALSTIAANNKLDNSTSQQILTGGGKRKKKGNKGNKLVVDGACLGFKGTADPNRVNIGEIDTVGGGNRSLT